MLLNSCTLSAFQEGRLERYCKQILYNDVHPAFSNIFWTDCRDTIPLCWQNFSLKLSCLCWVIIHMFIDLFHRELLLLNTCKGHIYQHLETCPGSFKYPQGCWVLWFLRPFWGRDRSRNAALVWEFEHFSKSPVRKFFINTYHCILVHRSGDCSFPLVMKKICGKCVSDACSLPFC